MRCFLAAWPDETARRRCAQLTDALRPHAVHGRVMRADNLHLTLAFIGDLPDTDAPGIATACAALPAVQHDWHLDAIGFFARPRVLWAGGPLTPELAGIADRARALLDDLKVSYDRKPFVPHVTLLRDVRRFDGPTEISPPIPWAIGEIALYRSGRDERGARYFRVEPG